VIYKPKQRSEGHPHTSA